MVSFSQHYRSMETMPTGPFTSENKASCDYLHEDKSGL